MSYKNEGTGTKVLKAGIGYTVGNYLIKGITFLTIPIFSRLLSTYDYGEYSTYIAYETIFSAVFGLALHMSLKNAKYKYEDRYQSYVSSVLLIEVSVLVILEIIANMLYGLIGMALGLDRFILNMLVIHCICSSILSLYNVHLSLSYSYRSYMTAAGFNAITNVLLSVLLINSIFNEERYFGRVFGTVIPLVILAVFIVIYFWKKARPHFNKAYWSFGFRYSVPLIPHAVSQVILNQFDRIMVKSMVGNSEAGIYSFAYNIYLIVEVTKTSLDNVWGPWFYEKYKNKQFHAIKERSSFYATAMFLFSSIVMLSSPEIIKILGTESYYDAVYCVIPICAAGFFSFMYTLPAQVEYFFEKTYFIAIGTTVAAFLNIVLNAVFVRCFGYVAAAYTTEFTYLVYFVLHYFIAKKINKEHIFVGKKFAVLAGLCVIVSLIGVIFVEVWLLRWVLLGFFTAMFFVLLKKNGFIDGYLPGNIY